MGIWQKIKSKVKNWVSGGSEKATPPKVRTSSSNPRSKSQTTYSSNSPSRSGRVTVDVDDKKEKERLTNAFKAKSFEAKDITEAVKKPKYSPESAKKSGLDKALNTKKDTLKEIQKQPDLKSTLKSKSAENREAYNKATNNRYNVKGAKDTAEKLKRRQAQKSQAYDVKAERYETKAHPIITSAARGATSGATFGASELIAQKSKNRKESGAEEFYQKNKNKYAEAGGEIAGSLASFGLTAGGTEKAAAKVGGKAMERGTERLAESEIIKRTATRSVNKAVKKGLVGEASEELIKQVGKDKAKKIVGALGADVVQNLTTGAIYDVNRASTEHEVGSNDWWEELGKSAAFNFGITGAVAGASALSGGKGIAKEAATKLDMRRDLRGLAESRAGATQITTPRIGESIEDRIARVDAERLGTKADDVAEKIATPNVARETSETATKPNTQLNIDDKIGRAAKASAEDAQVNLEDAVKTPDNAKTTPPKTAAQKEAAEAAERNALNDVMRKREENLAASIREQTGGEYAYRQGEHTAAEHASMNEAKRIEDEQKKVYKQLKDGDFKEMFSDSNSPFGVFKTANKDEMRKAATDATARVREDTYGAIHRIVDLSERLEKDLTTKSALSSAEHITLQDIADITAIRNIYDEAGVALPAEYETAFSHVIEWQRTEAAQMLKSVDLFLKENDQAYRRAFIARDTDRYLRRVINASDTEIADIKRSLDANHGEGYFDRMIDELSKMKGAENEAAFRKAYADFQAEIFMNTKPTVWDTVNLWRHAFMLSSPKTGANNIIGNVMQRTMYDISDAMNLVGEKVAQAVNKDAKRTTALLKTSDQRRLANIFTSGKLGERNLKDAKYLTGFNDQAFADTINMVSDADVGEMMASSKYMGDVIKGLNYKPTTVGGKVKQGFVKSGRFGNEYVSIMLNEPDSWFVERNYRSALLKYLEANGANSSEALANNDKLLTEARAYAKDIALENTYKNANNVVSFLEGLRAKGHTKGSNAGYKVAAITLDAELPYLKVPANLIVNNFKYSPLGLGKGALDAFKGVVSGDADLLNRATRELSKGLTGTGMMALGYMMFCEDQTDDNSWGFIANAEDELKEYGVRDNSFKLGNHNYSIANMGIGSVQFLMGASLAEDLVQQGAVPPHQVALDSISKTVDTVADMSLMENAVSLLDAFGNGGDYNATLSDRFGNASMEIAGDYAAQFVPNPLRGVAKGITSADLDTGVKKGDTTKVQRVIQRNVNNFVQGIPVANEKILPHKVDTHGNLIGERNTNKEKLEAVLNNTFNPLSPKNVNIPEADKIELQVKDENGKSFKPNGFDSKREYKTSIGQGKYKETIDLTGKEREQVARAAKNAGFDIADAVVKKGMFGDRLGDRAQSILRNIPDDEEKAREMLFSTPEWKNLSNDDKNKYLNIMYGQGGSNNNRMGVERTRKAEAYINVAGNSEGDFRYQNDLNWQYQKKYEDYDFAKMGIDKGTYADVIQSIYDSSHKWDEENKKNIDTPNSAKKVKAGILAIEGLSPEQRVAIYQAIRGKRNGFGWYDWDGVSSGGSGYYRRGYGGWHHYGHGGGSKARALKQSNFKATKRTYKDTAATLKTNSSRSKGLSTSNVTAVKVEPPKVKFKKYNP